MGSNDHPLAAPAPCYRTGGGTGMGRIPACRCRQAGMVGRIPFHSMGYDDAHRDNERRDGAHLRSHGIRART